MKFYEYETNKLLDFENVIAGIEAVGLNNVCESAYSKYMEKFGSISEEHASNMTNQVILGSVLWDQWKRERRPFFRLWPGFLHAAESFKVSDIEIKDMFISLPKDITTLCIEFPCDSPIIIDDWYKVRTIFVSNCEGELPQFGKEHVNARSWITAECGFEENGHFRSAFQRFSKKNDGEHSLSYYIDKLRIVNERNQNLDDRPQQETANKLIPYVCKILALVSLISRDPESQLLKPVIINKFAEKYEQTKDPEYVRKSINRGLFGWDIGRELPTSEEIEAMKRRGQIEFGEKCPHWRNGYWGWKRVLATNEHRDKDVPLDEKGYGRAYRFNKGTFIHEDAYKKVPQGFKDER